MDSVRLDLALVQQGIAESRSKAQQLIADNCVTVNGTVASKPSAPVTGADVIEQIGNSCPYVSRGGLKLERALNVFAVAPANCVCGDFGASTGGFTDCLLQHGASKVYAIDVGSNQLADKLRSDTRVVVMENTNVRDMQPDSLPEQLDLAVIDVSFISLRLVLPSVLSLLKQDGKILCLIKPQFEAGKRSIGKRGIVRSPEAHHAVLRDFIAHSASIGLFVQKLTFSPVRGGEGNIEFLALLTGCPQDNLIDITDVVFKAHQQL